MPLWVRYIDDTFPAVHKDEIDDFHEHLTDRTQPRPQGLLAFKYGGGRREDPGRQRTKTIADWCIPLRVHTCALIGLFIPKQRWLPLTTS